MSVAFDATAAGNVGGASTSLTISHTCTGSNRLLLVGVNTESTNGGVSDAITGVTYNGVAMTLLKKVAPAAIGNTNDTLYLFGLVAPATGANNIVISGSGSQNGGIQSVSESYTGVNQILPSGSDIQSGTAASATTLTLPTLTPTYANSWVAFFASNLSTATTLTSSGSLRQTGVQVIGDTNATVSSYAAVFSTSPTSTSIGGIAIALAPAISGQIAFDAVGGGTQSSGATLTYSHTCTGSNLILRVGVYIEPGSAIHPADVVTGVTYNGVAMTLLGKIGNTTVNFGDYTYLFELVAPATGTHNVVVSLSDSTYSCVSNSASYSGAKQTLNTNIVTAKQDATGSTFSIGPLTTLTDTSWIGGCSSDDGNNGSITSGDTSRKDQSGRFIFDVGPVSPTGSHSTSFSSGAGAVWTAILAEIVPFVTITSINISDTGSGIDSPSILGLIPITDTSSGVDAVSIFNTLPTLTETSSGVDAVSVTNPIDLSETASGVDVVAVGPNSIPIADTGSGVDAITVGPNSISVTDTGSGVDSGGAINLINLPEVGEGVDNFSILGLIPLADIASGADALSVLNSFTIADTASGSDVVAILEIIFKSGIHPFNKSIGFAPTYSPRNNTFSKNYRSQTY